MENLRANNFLEPNAVKAMSSATRPTRQVGAGSKQERFVNRLRLKTHLISVFALVLALSAFCLQFVASCKYIDAAKLETQDYLNKIVTPNLFADTLLHNSRMLSYCSIPLAAISLLCLFLDYRKKQPKSLF